MTVDAELIERDEKVWVKLVARAEDPAQEAAALEINNRSAAWAYALSGLDADALAPPLRTLVPTATE